MTRAALGAAASAGDAAGDARHDRAGCVSLYHGSQGIFSAAGYRTTWPEACRRRRIFRFTAMQQKLTQFVDIVQKRSGGGQRRRLYRRRERGTRREHVHLAEAAQRAQNVRGSGDRPAARKAGARAGGDALSAGGAGRARSADGRAMRNINTRCRATTAGLARVGAEDARRNCGLMPSCATCIQRPAEQGIAGVAGDRSGYRGAAGIVARGDRQHAVRRVRAAAGVDDVHAASISITW